MQPGCQATRKPGNQEPAAGQPGNQETRKPENQATRKPGTRKPGNQKTRQPGNQIEFMHLYVLVYHPPYRMYALLWVWNDTKSNRTSRFHLHLIRSCLRACGSDTLPLCSLYSVVRCRPNFQGRRSWSNGGGSFQSIV